MTDYLTDFVQESEERITELNNALLTLERDPDDEEAMENIFRIAHTLKGNCGAMGLDSASDLAHAIEDLLDAVRGGELEVTAELMDVVFDAVDELETMIDEVAADGEIETDPSETITALREHLAAATTGISTPTPRELDDVCSRFDPPAATDHDVYLARLEIAQRKGVNNGDLVVDALVDAFDLIGTDPPRETIAADEYGGSFDAVFATAVGEAAIASGLEPVEEVDDFEIVDVTDRFDDDDVDDDEPAEGSADAAETGADISPDEAQDLEVDELLDEFDEFDDLDEMVEEVDEEELEAFEDMGEAGSFDDLLDEEDVDELDAEPGEPPTEPLEGADETGADVVDDQTDDGAAAADAEAGSASDGDDEDDVEDASAVFNELKDEVEMVGFDELQDELEELEFDEFDEEEVDMDELLGEDAADDDAFLEESDPTESEVDDILVESEPDDVGSEPADVEAESTSTETSADTDEPDESADDLESTADVESADDLELNGGSEVADDDVVTADSEMAADDLESPDRAATASGDGATTADDSLEETETDELVEFDEGGVEDDVGDDGTADDETGDDVTAPDSGAVDETAESVFGDEAASDVDGDEDEDGDETSTADRTADAAEAVEASTDEIAESETDETVEAERGEDTALEADETPEAEADEDTALDVDGTGETAGFDDATTSESLGTDVDEFEGEADDTDPFADEEYGELSDDGFDEPATDPVDLEADVDDDFDSGFDDSLDEQPVGEEFAEPDEFEVDDAGFDSGASDVEMESAASFGDGAADGDDGDGDDADVERILEEPEMDIPDITVPETSDRPDADAETDEIQSVRVDVEQIDSLLTLVEGLVTSRVRLRHAADADDDGSALETELDALSDLTTDLQETVMDIRLVPLRTVTNRLPRVVRDIARDQNKEVAFEMTGEDVELDRSILDRIGDPLIHLVRNAVDHGVEPPERREEIGKPREGAVEVHADRSRDRVTITVEDDGSGLDPDRLRSEAVDAGIVDEAEAEAMSDEAAYELIFHPGLSTVDEVTDVSGRGVGMDVVKRTVEDLDGTVSIDSDDGEGTSVTMTLPVTVAIDEILFLESGGEEFGVPTKAVRDIEPATAVERADGESVLPGDDADYPVISLADVLETPAPGANGDGMVVRIRDEVREVALHCDQVHGQQEVVVKPFEGFMSDIPGLSGATVRGRGEVVNILDVTTL